MELIHIRGWFTRLAFMIWSEKSHPGEANKPAFAQSMGLGISTVPI